MRWAAQGPHHNNIHHKVFTTIILGEVKMRNGWLMLLLLVPLCAQWALPSAARGAEDLEVVRMVLAETTISPGGRQLLQITLGNSGPKTVRAGMKVDIRDARDRRIGAPFLKKIDLASRDERKVFFPFQAPVSMGNYSVRFELFTRDFGRKLLPGAPVFYTPFTVGPGRVQGLSGEAQKARIRVPRFLPPSGMKFELPDLVWERLSIKPPNLLVGENLRIRADLRNIGGDIAQGMVVRVDYFNTRTPGRLVPIAKSNVNTLAPGERLEMEFEAVLPDNAILGQYRVVLHADFADVVEEADEVNNRLITAPIRLSHIKLLFPESGFSFDETGLFLFRWDTLRFDEFKVQVGTDSRFSDQTAFFDIPQGEKWTKGKEIVPLEGELPSMAQGLTIKAKTSRLFWRVKGRNSKTGKSGFSAVQSFTIKPEKKEEEQSSNRRQAPAGQPSPGTVKPPSRLN